MTRGRGMGLALRSFRIACTVIVAVAVVASIVSATLHAGRAARADQAEPKAGRSLQLGVASPGALYAVTVDVKDPAQLHGNDAVRVTVNDASGEIESKWLHSADLDLYLTLQPRSAGPISVSLASPRDVQLPAIVASMKK